MRDYSGNVCHWRCIQSPAPTQLSVLMPQGQNEVMQMLYTYVIFCCTDINECLLGSHNCEQLCSNVPGSFNCSCRSGYILNNDGRTCRASELDKSCTCMYSIIHPDLIHPLFIPHRTKIAVLTNVMCGRRSLAPYKHVEALFSSSFTL